MNSRQKTFAQTNLSRQIDKKKDLLIETDRAIVMKDAYPKAQYHFLVVAREDIPNVTAVSCIYNLCIFL